MLNNYKHYYQNASIKFIWKYKDIEDYIPVITLAIKQTFDWFNKIGDESIKKSDIGAIIVTDNNNKKVGFALYIKNKKFGGLGTLYSIFKKEYKTITKGYDDSLGIRFPPSTTIDEFIKFHKACNPNNPEDKITEYWNQIQRLKRKITNFTTLGNKSLNRGRRVPPKLRFEVLKRDKFRCVLCGRTAEDTKLNVDHIIAVVKGGKKEKDNLATLCIDCNLGKGISGLF